MNCADARHMILSADPAALRDRTDPVLRKHLEACADCATAAGHVVADLGRLRSALAARAAHLVARPHPRSRPRRVALTLVPLALAAELALFAFLGASESSTALDRRPMADDSVTHAVPAAHTEIDTGDVAVASAPKRHVASVRRASATPRPDTVARPRDSIVAPTLHVTPVARQQYAVIATSNPKVTVVWLTRGDTL